MRMGFWAALIGIVAACSSNDKASTAPLVGQGGSAGSEGSGSGTGGDVADAQEDVESCGMMSCKAGEYCCDGTCGACSPIGVNCPLDPCKTGAGIDAATE